MTIAHRMFRNNSCRIFFLFVATVFLIIGCGGFSSEVVRVTAVEKDPYQGLKKDDVAKIERLRKTISEREEGNDNLSSLVGKTPNYTVAEYLR